MFYNVFEVFLCFFIFSGTAVSTRSKVFYISGYNTSKAIRIDNTIIKYQFEKNEVLNLSCNNKQKKPVIWLRWWHNEQSIPGIKDNSNESKLLFNISKSNDKDRLTCYAFEDDTGLMKDDKKYEKTAIIILEYVGREDTTMFERNISRVLNIESEDSENWFEKLPRRTLFWIGLVVSIVVIILVTVVVVANKRSYSIKEDKVVLHPAVSNASVFSTESKTPIIPQLKITQARYYSNNNTYCKTPLYASSEIINSEYQEPIDSQAYCEPHTYSEPEKQFYAEPIPKILRMKKDNVYVNYNKSMSSVNINKENMDLYENCDNICDDKLNYYTGTC